MTPAEQIKEKILHLEQQLNSNAPDFPNLLRTIHTQLQKDEELVTLLTEGEIAIITDGLSKKTKIDIVTTSAKQTKSMSRITLDDL